MCKQNLIVSIISAILLLSAVNCSCPGTGPAQQPPTPAAPAVSQSPTPAAPAVSQPTEPAGLASKNQMAMSLAPETAATEMALGTSREELTAQWRTLVTEAAEGKANPDFAAAVAQALVTFGPDALNPLFDTLADSNGSSLSKIIATLSIKGVINPTMIDRLLQIAKPENEFTSRACAVDLLGNITDPRVATALNEYKNDTDRRVRLSAIYGLAKRSPEGCKALVDLWKAPDTTTPERNGIVGQLANAPGLATQASVLEILHSAIQNPAIDESLRLASITALGQIGASESRASLAACAEKDPSQAVKDAAKSTLDAIAAQANAPKPNPGS